MKPLLTPKLDLVFKLLFTKDTEMLADLISSVLNLSGDRRIRDVKIKNPEILPEDLAKKIIILDIHATDGQDHEYDIEMQAQKYDIYPKRALYYLCSIYADQLESGDDYGELNPVVGIHFLDYEMFPKTDDFHFHFMLKDIRYPKLNLTEDLSLHIFELPKIIINPMRAGVRTPLDEWLNFFNNADQETEESMRKNYHNPMILKAYDLLENMSADEETRVRAKAREKALKDEKSFLAEAERKGIEKGMKIGKAEGKAENRKEMALKLISMGILTDEQVAEATGFTVQEIETLKSEK